MVDYVPSEKGQPIRNPSTANLAINSRDRARVIPSVTVSVTNIESDGTTITVTANNYFTVGQAVTLSNLTGTAISLNGTYVIASVTGGPNPFTVFTITSTRPIVASVAQTAQATSIIAAFSPQPYLASSSNFTISNKNNILTGFFTRIAVNEIVMSWNRPNIISGINNEFIIRIGSTNTSVVLSTGFYTIKEALDVIVVELNTALGASTFSIQSSLNLASLEKAAGQFAILLTPLSSQLGFVFSTSAGNVWNFGTSFAATAPFLLNDSYIDFCSNTLTYCQDLKDGSTALVSRDILYRWNFGWDDEPTYDAYGYPILQGYRAFNQRRSIQFPKQIKWDNIQPIGQINFQLFASDGNELYQPNPSISDPTIAYWGDVEYSFNLLVSEV